MKTIQQLLQLGSLTTGPCSVKNTLFDTFVLTFIASLHNTHFYSLPYFRRYWR
jgi:hypothetical protein